MCPPLARTDASALSAARFLSRPLRRPIPQPLSPPLSPPAFYSTLLTSILPSITNTPARMSISTTGIRVPKPSSIAQ